MVWFGFVEILNLYEYFYLSYNLFKRIYIKKWDLNRYVW